MTDLLKTKYNRIVALACRAVHLVPRPYQIIQTVKRGVWLELDVLPEEIDTRRIFCIYDVGQLIDIHVESTIKTRHEILMISEYNDKHAFLRNDVQERRYYMDDWSSRTIDQIETIDDAVILDSYHWVTISNMIPRAEWPAIKRAIVEERPGECTMFQTRDYNIYVNQWSIRVERNNLSAFIQVRPPPKKLAHETTPLTADFWRDQDAIDRLVQDSQSGGWLRRF